MHEVDVVIIGAGAAGVAAASRLATSALRVLVLEARDRIGGRAWTINSYGFPLDLGCGWLHSADENEWSTIAKKLGFEIDPTPPPWTRPACQIGFPTADQEDFRSAWDRFHVRLDQAAERGTDRPAAEFLEPGCRWNGLFNALSSYINGVELDQLSVLDHSRYRDTGVNWRVVRGYGTLIEANASGLAVELSSPATLVDHSGNRLQIETPRGQVVASVAIITAPPSIIASELLRFHPPLWEKLDAAHALPLGLADKVFLCLNKAADFPRGTRLFGAIDRAATGSYHLRPFGRPIIEGYFGGQFARELEREGDKSFARFAIDQIAALLGNDMRNRLHPLVESAWGRDPFALGSYSFAKVGQPDARAVLAAAVDNRLFFAGEACSYYDFSTAHGAYRTGVEAAEQVLGALRLDTNASVHPPSASRT
jgi:monoamine oxidase